MPTYDYACKTCGHRFEEFQSMTAEPLTDCPACSATSLQRLIGAGAGLLFKGSGFYLTDYKNDNTSPTKASAANGSVGSSSGSSEASSASDTGSGTGANGTDKSPADSATQKS